MTAHVIQDQTLDMALEPEDGYRAVCADPACNDGWGWVPIEGEHVFWNDVWRRNWIDAELDAFRHNHEEHEVDDVVWIRNHSGGEDPLLPDDLERLPGLLRPGGLLRRSARWAQGRLLQALRRA